MALIANIRRKFSMIDESIMNARSTRPTQEIIYYKLFTRDIAKIGIEDCYYALGGAANYSLLYFITRAFLEFPIWNVLELGAGQSSILIDQLAAKLNKAPNIRTVEHDASWAASIQDKVRHSVHIAPLETKPVHGQVVQYYQAGYCDSESRYDFVIIDGPPAHTGPIAMSRIGAIELVDKLADDFILIVDDAERRGEAMLVGMVRARLRVRSAFSEGAIMATKRQHIFAGGAYSGAVYF